MTTFGHQTRLISTYSAVRNWPGVSFFDNIQSASYSKIVVWLFEACITVLESKWRTNETDFQCDFSWKKHTQQKLRIFEIFQKMLRFLRYFQKIIEFCKKVDNFKDFCEFSKISQKYRKFCVDSQEISFFSIFLLGFTKFL